MRASPQAWTRRDFLRLLAGGSVAALACSDSPSENASRSARLTARPPAGPPAQELTPGLWTLGLGTTAHDGLLTIPAGYVAGQPTPLLLGLHGAGARASDHTAFMGPYADAHGFVLLTVDAYGSTWDAIGGGSGDLAFIDAALRHAFDRCTVDPARIGVEGFSDGASYALQLGLANGDLFSRVVAFSPGFIPPTSTPPHGQPEFFVSHGVQDPVLPIDGSSRVIVPALQNGGYAVTYVEFAGGHTIPAAVADQAAMWMVR